MIEESTWILANIGRNRDPSCLDQGRQTLVEASLLSSLTSVNQSSMKEISGRHEDIITFYRITSITSWTLGFGKRNLGTQLTMTKVSDSRCRRMPCSRSRFSSGKHGLLDQFSGHQLGHVALRLLYQ